MVPRNISFLIFNVVTAALFYGPARESIDFSLKSEIYSYIILIPLISGYFIYVRRKRIFSEPDYSYRVGILVTLAGIVLYFIAMKHGVRLVQNDRLALLSFSGVIFWIGGFMLFYGAKSFRAAAFPLLFLFFLAPIPNAVTEKFISLLQIGSAEAAHLFFTITGAPLLREGFTFHLPGLSIVVAEQCSGIRSSVALVITSVIAGELFLHSGWKRLILVLSVFPVTIFKNGLRIVTLSLLGLYVDPRILDSQAHRSGGIPFFVVALLLLAPVLWALIKSEKSKKGGMENRNNGMME